MDARFTIGTTFKTGGKYPHLCTVVDIHRTYNDAGELVKIRYVATHEFMGQVVRDQDVVDTTIAKGIQSESATTIIHHNGEHGLRNGSYTAEKKGKFHSYMNGDYMGEIPAVPKHQEMQSNVQEANRFLPKCCKQK